MANQTVKDAMTIKGTNPQYLVEKIIRSTVKGQIVLRIMNSCFLFLSPRTRIYDSKYWKENCFALTAELLVDKAMELRWVLTLS